MASCSNILSHTTFPRYPTPSYIVVGNDSLLPVTANGATVISPSLHLNNVLVSQQLIKNLISVCQFTLDNNCSIEFDPTGCSVKDLLSRNVIVRCNSSGPLYPLRLPAAHSLVAATESSLWRHRLGHPGHEALSKLALSLPTCHHDTTTVCHACQLGRHVRLPFHLSTSRASNKFDLIHCDLWTSPVLSVSGYKYYLAILDDCSHYLWTFPLKLKSDAFPTIAHFLPLCPLSSAPPSRQFSATTVVSLTTPAPALSSLPMVFASACRAHTLPLRTVRPRASFVPLTM